uniref:Serpin domain-containing protein n=1 Tax=Salvator merianae TaxID=96440 RepID=A0A8D0CDT9_SALMN
MKSTTYLCMVLVALSPVAHGHHTGSAHNETSLAASKLYPSFAQFSLNLYKQLSSAFPGKNIFFSPVSIATTLACLSLGARSTTRTQILEGLGFNLTEIQEKEIHEGFHDLAFKLSQTSNEVQIDAGQALFLKENITLKQTFLDNVNIFYEADVTSAKFQIPEEAEKQINSYVEKKTRGKITQLVKDLDPDTALVMINYIFFKGNWKKVFDPELTQEMEFFVDEETTIKVPMMLGKGWFDFYFDIKRTCTVLRLDYNDTVSAIFVLPERGKEKQLEEDLSLDTLTEWTRNLQRHQEDVYLPKFEVSTSYSLKDTLSKLHITDVFSDHADLSGITEQAPLKLSKVSHKAVVSIDERGTTASAATAVEIIFLSWSPPIKFSHPFLVFIFETETNNILFLGKIANPKEH